MTYDPQHEQPPQRPWQQPPSHSGAPPQQPAYPAPQYPAMPVAKPSRRILGMPVWAFVIGLVAVVCCGGFGVFAGFGSLMQGVEDGLAEDPTFTCAVLSTDNNEVLPSVEVEWQITNPDDREYNGTVNITVLDGQGRQIGQTFDGAFGTAAGATVVDTETVFLDTAPDGSETCAVAVNE